MAYVLPEPLSRPFSSSARATSLPPSPLEVVPGGALLPGWGLSSPPLETSGLSRRTDFCGLGYTPVIRESPTGPGPSCSVGRFQVDPGPNYWPDGAADIFDIRMEYQQRPGSSPGPRRRSSFFHSVAPASLYLERLELLLPLRSVSDDASEACGGEQVLCVLRISAPDNKR